MNVIPCTGAVFREMIEGRGGEVFVQVPPLTVPPYITRPSPRAGTFVSLSKRRGPVPLVPLTGIFPVGPDTDYIAHFVEGENGWGIDAEKDGWLMKGTA